jgi:hypothetical protein
LAGAAADVNYGGFMRSHNRMVPDFIFGMATSGKSLSSLGTADHRLATDAHFCTALISKRHTNELGEANENQ